MMFLCYENIARGRFITIRVGIVCLAGDYGYGDSKELG